MVGLRHLVAAAGIAWAMAPLSALAQTDICAALESRLALLDGSAGSFGNNDADLDRAILVQRLAYDRVNIAARRAGCMGGAFGSPGSVCAPLLARVQAMTANLNQLEAQRRRTTVNPFTAVRERASVLRELAMNQCGNDYTAYGTPDTPRQPLFASLYGPDMQPGGDDGYRYANQSATYRTLCVRTCDGYYFPVSFSTVPSQFSSDEQSCQALCPGAPVALYVYRNPGEDVNSMVSLDGRPYTALPTAFKYRKSFDAACSCHGAASPATHFAPLPVPVTPSDGSVVTISGGAPATAEPGTAVANEAGAAAPTGEAEPPRAVRIVGPSDYVAQ